MNAAHCAACHLTFTAPYGFDLHRKDGRCLTVRQITSKGLAEIRPGMYGTPRETDEDQR
jgi:hypothetical protein